MHKYCRIVLASCFSLGLSCAALAQGLSIDLGLDSARTLNWVLGGAGLDFYFTSSRFYQAGQSAGDSSLITVSRASVGYADDISGNWLSFNNNVGRITNKGLLVEEARTNSIRNNSMQGAVAGSPGTLPTNWTITSLPTGLTRTIAVGTANGVDYIDLNFNGTAGSTLPIVILNESVNQIAASPGQTWSDSQFLMVPLSDPAVITFQANIQGTNGAAQTELFTQANIISSLSASVWFRNRYSATLANAGTTNVRGRLSTNTISSGAVINFTLRIGWPQLENNNINSTVASAAIAAGGTTGVAGTAVYQVGGGTGTAATLNVTVSGGAITAINSVASAGNYTVFPPSPAALTYVSGTGSGVVGATVNLTPTDNSAQGFATSPILTTGAAATRAADVVSVTNPPVFGSAYTLFGKGTPNAPASSAANQWLIVANDGSVNNRAGLQRNTSGNFGPVITSGGSSIGPPTGAAWVQNTSGKGIVAYAQSDQAASFNDGAILTNNSALVPAAFSTISLGNIGGVAQWNGYVERIALWPSLRLPNATLQSLTQ